MTRKGRLDEVFFVDLPDDEQRSAILRAVLVSKGRDPAGFDLQRICAATDGFSGAEMSELVVSAMFRAYCDGQSVATEHLLAEAAQTQPLSVIRAEDVAALRRWAQGRAVRA